MAALTTDPNDPRIKRGLDDIDGKQPQNEAYLILSEEERAKGFVRPVRRAYIHIGKASAHYPLRDLTEEEHQRYDKFGYIKYEEYPESESPLCGKFWTQETLNKINNGCKAETVMSQEIAETYARNPKFYGATYCIHCQRHIAVDEFVWSDTDERVGS